MPILMLSGLALLAGCASAQTGARQKLAQYGVYSGQVVALHRETSDSATPRIMQLLGWPDEAANSSGEEILVRLATGQIKSFIPSASAIPAGLAVGSQVTVSTTPTLRVILQ